MNYEYLKQAIEDAIKENHRQEITGDLLQQILLGMVDNMATYRYMGIATPDTHPVRTDSNIMFIASQSGTYTYMGSLTVGINEFALLRRDTEWHKDILLTSATATKAGLFTAQDKSRLDTYEARYQQLSAAIAQAVEQVGIAVQTANTAVTKANEALEEVDAALDGKVDKVSGKGLSTNDYTTAEKNKLGALPTAAELASELEGKADVGDSYTKDEEDELLEGKQDVIADLATIRNNASAGKAASDSLGGHTVGKDVPSNAVFTDTVYDDTEVRGLISAETTRATDAEDGIAEDVAVIESKIPAQASATNQLADKEFVNSSVATNTANYISDDGEPFTSIAALPTSGVTNNDYAFVTGTDTEGNTYFDRYKATVSGSTVSWAKEYRLNNSSFTAVQWAAITSGITAALVGKLNDLPTNSQLTALLAGKADTSDIPTMLSQLSGDSTHRTVTDTEKSTWNAKSDFSGNYNDLTNKPTIPSIEGLATEEYVDNGLSGKVSKSDIVDNLASTATDKVVSARAISEDLVNYIDGSISNTLDYVEQQDASERNARIAGDNLKADKATTYTKTEIQEFFEPLVPYLSYGIEFDTLVSTPNCTRIGATDLHKRCPIQNRMRGCLLDDDGQVVEYLDPLDWSNNDRTGDRGQVMVEIPMHYRRFETDGTKRRVLLSELPIPGYHQVPKAYVSAYQATVQRSTNKLASVVNDSTDYRGGNNTSAWDGTYRSLLGRPATSISRTNFRAYARNRKSGSTEWNCYTYDIYKTVFWLFVVEYATLNSQANYNAEKTADGYCQGGLGAGVTNWDGTVWSNFNNHNPFVPCGYTDELGNRTGVKSYTASNDDDIEVTSSVPRYHGIENPFGHIWHWVDGVNVKVSAEIENGGDGTSKVYVCHDPSLFKDNGYDGYSHVGDEPRNEGYIKEVIFGEEGDIDASVAAGAGSSTYFCDYHYTAIPTSGEALRGLLFGGGANNGAYAGLAYSHSYNAPSYSTANIGSRLCFIPSES